MGYCFISLNINLIFAGIVLLLLRPFVSQQYLWLTAQISGMYKIYIPQEYLCLYTLEHIYNSGLCMFLWVLYVHIVFCVSNTCLSEPRPSITQYIQMQTQPFRHTRISSTLQQYDRDRDRDKEMIACDMWVESNKKSELMVTLQIVRHCASFSYINHHTYAQIEFNKVYPLHFGNCSQNANVNANS